MLVGGLELCYDPADGVVKTRQVQEAEPDTGVVVSRLGELDTTPH